MSKGGVNRSKWELRVGSWFNCGLSSQRPSVKGHTEQQFLLIYALYSQKIGCGKNIYSVPLVKKIGIICRYLDLFQCHICVV